MGVSGPGGAAHASVVVIAAAVLISLAGCATSPPLAATAEPSVSPPPTSPSWPPQLTETGSIDACLEWSVAVLAFNGQQVTDPAQLTRVDCRNMDEPGRH